MNWLNTALDIQIKILLYLHIKDIKTFCLVYKSKACSKDSILWRKLIYRYFKVVIVNPYTNLKNDYINFEHYSDVIGRTNEDLVRYGKYLRPKFVTFWLEKRFNDVRFVNLLSCLLFIYFTFLFLTL